MNSSSNSSDSDTDTDEDNLESDINMVWNNMYNINFKDKKRK